MNFSLPKKLGMASLLGLSIAAASQAQAASCVYSVSNEWNTFFFNYTATTEIYTLSLHDALPIYSSHTIISYDWSRSEEHTSELQSHDNLVCRLLLEKKKT